MRAIIFALLLSLPALAFAGDCDHGNNTPLNSDTASHHNNNDNSNEAIPGHSGFGSNTAQKTAYPH